MNQELFVQVAREVIPSSISWVSRADHRPRDSGGHLGDTGGPSLCREQLEGRNVCRGCLAPPGSLQSPSDQSHHSVDLSHVVALQGQQVPPLIRDSVTLLRKFTSF